MILDATSLARRITDDSLRDIGIPTGRATADFAVLNPLYGVMLNHLVADHPYHLLDVERAVIARTGTWFRFATPAGHVTANSTHAVLAALRLAAANLARTTARRPTVYHSAAAHRCVTGTAALMNLPTVAVPTRPDGAMDLDALADALHNAPGPVIVVATAGTTFDESADRPGGIRVVLDATVSDGHGWIHLDGALSGPPLALSPPWWHLVDAVDSASFSTWKWLGTNAVGGILLTDGHRLTAVTETTGLPYKGAHVTTLETSRDGRAAVETALVLERGDDDLAGLAAWCRALAETMRTRLADAGIDARRHPWALTVTLPYPGDQPVRRYHLPRSGDGARVAARAMPGTPAWVLAEFCTAVGAPIAETELVEAALAIMRGTAVTPVLTGGG